MEKEHKDDQQIQAITYYGKKAYWIHPLLARTKPIVDLVPDYGKDTDIKKK